MIGRDSRYRGSKAFEPDPRTGRRVPGVRPRTIGRATGIIEHTVRSEDRLDTLAQSYYDDASLWWRIVDANPGVLWPGAMLSSLVGQTIVIPRTNEEGR